jgi:diacylglycerol kinase
MPDNPKNFSIRKRLVSFRAAFAGLKSLLLLEHNSRIHLIAAILAILSGVVFKISVFEWLIVVIVTGLVFVTEILNSAIENLADKVSKVYDVKIKQIKDYSAAAVLISSIIALVAGVLIFGPKVLLLL